MKISTKGRYALRVMIDLGLHGDEGNVSLKDISKRQEISMKYLEQIMPLLIKGGLVRSVRGFNGGYSLIKSLSDYTPNDVIQIVEGPIAIVSCLETAVNMCSRCDQCPTVEFYQGLNKVIVDYLNSCTLQDLAHSLEEAYIYNI